MNHHWKRCVTAHDVSPMQAALVILILAVGVLSVMAFRAVDTAQHAQQELEDYQRLGCVRGNVIRGYLIIDAGRNAKAPAARQTAALDLFPIADCDHSLQTPVPPAEADRYLDALASRMGVEDHWRR